MDDQVIKYLKDISSSIGAIFEYLGDRRDFTVFKGNRLLRRAIEREFEIIGEATGKVLRLDAGFQLAHAKKIIGLRNLIAHAYDSVQEEILWGIIVNHLPSLKAEVDALLGSSEIRD
jgi:uncharacterized protein with HEPN domain